MRLQHRFCQSVSRRDMKNDEDLVCELSRDSDPACFRLCGAPLSVAHFDAYAAGCIKSTVDFVVDEEEKLDAACAALSRSDQLL